MMNKVGLWNGGEDKLPASFRKMVTLAISSPVSGFVEYISSIIGNGVVLNKEPRAVSPRT
jgi:hypothetical protein